MVAHSRSLSLAFAYFRPLSLNYVHFGSSIIFSIFNTTVNWFPDVALQSVDMIPVDKMARTGYSEQKLFLVPASEFMRSFSSVVDLFHRDERYYFIALIDKYIKKDVSLNPRYVG